MRWRRLYESVCSVCATGPWPLIIFVVICEVNVLGLLLDDYLDKQGIETITAHVRRCPALGVPIVVVQMIATIALAFHLWVRK